MQLWGSFPISTRAAVHGFLSVAFPEVSSPDGPAVAAFGGSWCCPHISAAASTCPGQENTKGWKFPWLLFQP